MKNTKLDGLKIDDKERLLTTIYRLENKLEELEGAINNFNHQYDDHISFTEHARIVDSLIKDFEKRISNSEKRVEFYQKKLKEVKNEK